MHDYFVYMYESVSCVYGSKSDQRRECDLCEATAEGGCESTRGS